MGKKLSEILKEKEEQAKQEMQQKRQEIVDNYLKQETKKISDELFNKNKSSNNTNNNSNAGIKKSLFNENSATMLNINKGQKSTWEQIKETASQGSNRVKTLNATKNTNSIWNQINALANQNNKVTLGATPVSIENKTNEVIKNKNISQDAGSLLKLTGLGISSGSKQVANYIETMTEQNNDVYKRLKEKQFLTSSKVNETDKAKVKSQNNLLLQMNGIKNNDEKIETNLVKKAIRDSIVQDEQEIQSEQSKLSNPVTQKLGDIAPSMGQMLPGMALSTVNPVLGTTYFTTSSGGSYINDALNRGMTEKQASKYGTVMGILEGVSDSFITGQQLNKISKAFGGKQISKNILNSYGFNIFENAVQEAIMEPAQEITAGIIGNKADWSNIGSRMLESGFNGALMGAISNGVTYGLEKSAKVYNKIKNKEQVTPQEYQEALQENINKFGKEEVEKNIKQGATETFQEIENISNLKADASKNQINLQKQQITQQKNKMTQNGNIGQILPTQNYYYEKSDNTKIDNLRKDANKYWNNSEKTKNYVNMLEKIIQDKDIDIRLDTNLKTPDGKIANGSYSNGVITINPNSTRTGEFIAIHELTHAIGTKDMLDMVNRYRESNAEFNSAVENLLQSYNTTELTEEALSDVSAQLFGNQEFINSIARNNPNIFQKIYSEIKYLWHQFRGYKNQNQFVEDLYYKWTQAYNSNNKLNETSNYHVSENLSTDIDNILTNINERNPVKLRDYTPEQLVKIGIKDLPIYENPSHMRKNILTKVEAINLGINVNDKDHYHGLGKETYIKAIDSLDDPRVIFKNKNNSNEYLILTVVKDNNNNNIIVPIEVETDTYVNNVKIDINRAKTVFGYDRVNPNLDEYIKYNIKNNKLEKIYEKKKPSTNIASQSASTNSIPSSNENVNTTKYSIQESENNSGSFNLQKNRFDVSGNENLVNAKTLFYRTRSDGQYYVQATDGSGKITYDGVFYGEKELARSLGEEIANKIVNTSESTNNEIYLQSDNIKSETDYMMAHRPTETGAYASNITKGTGEWDSLMPEDVYEHPEWYFDMNQEYSKESFKVLKQIKNNPNAEITIYRATTGNKINKGDWVTLSKKYAEYHNNSQFKGKGNIIELKVKAKDVQYAGDDINEFGYFPQTDIQTTDNQGRILSKEQQEYFKNSKVKDDNGQLITVYHGTNNAGFTQFNRNINYFTDNKNVAKTYTGKNEIYEGYINITNPITIDANEEIWSKIDINNILIDGIDDVKSFLDTYGASTWKESGTTRTSTADLVSAIYDAIDEGELNADGIIINNIYDEGAYSNSVGKQLGTDFVTFNSNQFKNIDNINPTDNPDIRFSQNNETWQQYIDKNYKPTGTRTNLKEVRLPTKEDVKTKLNLPTKENINKQDNQTTQGEKIDWNEIERPEGKIRKHYRSIIESSNTTKEAKAIAKELMGTDTYIPETNKNQLVQADYRISNSSPEAELKSLMSRATQGEKISSVDIAVGERLIQYYSKTGDKTNLQEAIQATAMAGTSAGQTVQALAMLNHQTPQGQATWIQRSVDKMNNELARRKGGTIIKDEDGNLKVINKNGKDITDKVDLFNLTPDMIEKIVNSKNKTEMYDNIDQIYEDLGQQVPLSTMEKIDSWRYFSMLANPKTHIRNMVGNFAMGKTQSIKDKLAGGIEDIVGTFYKDMERTKTLRPADAKTKEFAKNDVLNPDVQSMMELNENKYNPQSRLQNARKTFKNDVLENTLGRLFNWNDKLLEAEDALGLKSNYKKALANYLTANKIDVDNITDTQLSKARNYAVEQAKEATFHQANSIATAINQFSKKNKLTKGATDALLPFVKTPLNVAKTGIEYNPAGLLKTITYDTVKLRKGDITVNKYIDNLSKGLTGTGIAVLGYALADAGILKASGGEDDKKEKYDEALGNQAYSIKIGDKTYSLDWLAPVGIPLFVGAEAKAMKDSKEEEKSSISSDDNKKFNQAVNSLENLANAMANSMSPMSEMSMISGLTSALKSYEQDSTKMLGTIGTNAVKSYVNQFVPTLLGQVARTTDDYERSTTSTKTGLLSKAIDQTKLQVMSKVPGLRQMLPTKNDIWGNEQKTEANLPTRIVNNFVNPSTVKNINTSKVDKEIDSLYNKTGESKILPATIDKTYTINGQIYRMTNEEYSKYKKAYGQTSYKLLDGLINSKEYNNLSDEQKQKAIENTYSYAKELNKVDYANKSNLKIETSTLYNTMKELEKEKGNQSEYLNYTGKIIGIDKEKEKNQILVDSNYTQKTKAIIYKNTTGKDDEIYNNILYEDNVNINEYLKYKLQDFESDKKEDGTVQGKSISGSKKKKVYSYINNMNITRNQKIAILGTQYKLTKTEQTELYNYINNIPNQTQEEKLDIFSKYSPNFIIYKNNTMNFK